MIVSAAGRVGAVPAFDAYFVRTFRGLATGRKESAAFNNLGSPSLDCLAGFYGADAKEIAALARDLHSVELASGELGTRQITRAKVTAHGLQRQPCARSRSH